MTLRVTRITHSCVLLDFDGHRVLTDPWFSEKSGYLRGEPLGIALEDLPDLEAVVVSHAHYDHCDMATFAAYRDRQVPVIVKRGAGRVVRRHGFGRVIELDAGEQASVGPLTVSAEAAKHGVPENTYVLEGHRRTVFFGADTLRIPELDSIAERFPHLDLALLPINGLQIRPAFNRRVVMNAEEAAELCGVLRPKVAVPIHYRFTAGPVRDHLLLRYDGTPERFVSAARTSAPGTVVRVLDPGQPLELPTEGMEASGELPSVESGSSFEVRQFVTRLAR